MTISDETFVSYKRFRWVWIHLVLLIALVTVYYSSEPTGGRSGSTVVGYTYGTFAAAAILYLLWFGIRKRSHYAKYTTLKGCLAVHVCLGSSLAVIVPLHCAFQFGPNVHTLAYLLMLGAIGSGIVGAAIYLRLPTQILSHRGGGTPKALLEQVHALSNEIDWLTRERSNDFLQLSERVDFVYHPSVRDSIFGKRIRPVEPRDLAGDLAKLTDTERHEAFKLIGLVSRKRQLVDQIRDEIRILAIFRSWLFVHVPISYGLLAAVTVHIFSVFYLR